MFRPASRILLRAPISSPVTRAALSRRLVSTTSPAQKPRSWKSSALRWGLAATGVYYYNTHDVFAEDPAYAPASHEADDSENLPTIEQLAAQRRQRLIDAKNPSSKSVHAGPLVDSAPDADMEPTAVQELEEEAGQQGAFNPETGEINWDCPCLGGMAHGPCGEEFKAAFSCFVYSNEEPKGMDCIEKFKGMQDCFRQYPDIYGAELEDDDEDINSDELETPTPSPETAVASTSAPESHLTKSVSKSQDGTQISTDDATTEPTPRTEQSQPQPLPERKSSVSDQPSERDEDMPKQWHDARATNEGK